MSDKELNEEANRSVEFLFQQVMLEFFAKHGGQVQIERMVSDFRYAMNNRHDPLKTGGERLKCLKRELLKRYSNQSEFTLFYQQNVEPYLKSILQAYREILVEKY